MSRGDQHVVPFFRDDPEHVANERCWCHPTVDFTDVLTGRRVWIHYRPS